MKSKLITLTLLSILAFKNLTAQEPLLNLEASYTGDFVRNFSGGLKKGNSYLGLANFRLGFQTERARLWKGGKFFVNAANAHGGNPSEKLIGDFHTVSNIEADDITYIHELWFSQTIKNLEIIAGLQDLNTEFVSSNYGSMFINSTFGTPSTIADNVPSPIFPLTAVGLSLKWEFISGNTFKLAAFDGMPTDFDRNPYNLNWKINTNEGVLGVVEYQYSGRKGSYRAGAYQHSQEVETAELSDKFKNYGFYLIVDREIFTNPGREGGLGVFAQFAMSPKAINTHNTYGGVGISWQGLFSKRGEDSFGLALTYAGFNSDIKKAETIIEICYKAQLTENIFIQPDFQYVINPEGTDENLQNASVGFLRLGLSF